MPIARKAYEAHHRTRAEPTGTHELLREIIAQQKQILKALEKLTEGKKKK